MKGPKVIDVFLLIELLVLIVFLCCDRTHGQTLHGVRLKWTQSIVDPRVTVVNNAVYRAIVADGVVGAYAKIATIPAAETYEDTTTAANTKAVCYQVTAISSEGKESDRSNTACVGAPEKPSTISSASAERF